MKIDVRHKLAGIEEINEEARGLEGLMDTAMQAIKWYLIGAGAIAALYYGYHAYNKMTAKEPGIQNYPAPAEISINK